MPQALDLEHLRLAFGRELADRVQSRFDQHVAETRREVEGFERHPADRAQEGGDTELRGERHDRRLGLGLRPGVVLDIAANVHPPTGELGGQAGVLALFADGQRELPLGHDGHCRLVLLVDVDAQDLRRAEGARDQAGSVLVPLNDVDLLAVQLVYDVLYADAAQAHTGPDGVDAFLFSPHGDLASRAGLPRDRYDLNGAVVYLRHLHLEEPPHQFLVGARDDELRAPGGLPDRLKEHLELLADPVAVEGRLLGRRQDRFRAAKLHGDMLGLHPLDGGRVDLAFLVGELVVDDVALSVA